ncbi:hypothetical protein FDA94_12200 [Herbidospora galbida]|uniref:Uncharacterized protein n=1 Tax=Herbidospora galbida TaxID=2575442 RepID=A0A4U3MJS2_9ACTN|nr:hypothetical protein [Herbidospora galbida]TKK88832.1 hypothetical protein FDA94_12200 [Herbidospora galbida]
MRPHIEEDAETIGVPARTFEIQVRLHLPRLDRAALGSPEKAYEAIRVHAIIRAAEEQQSAREAAYQAHASVLLNVDKVRRDLSLSFTDDYRTTLRFDDVKPAVGHQIQSRLHYLRSERADTLYQFGLHLPGATMPLTYVAFSRCDRQYIMDALAGHGLKAHHDEILVLTRMHGLAGIPANLMSLTIGRAVRAIKERSDTRFVITAFNPMLGFEGTSFRAAGFRAIASSPVTYAYDRRGFFQTRRISRKLFPQRLDTPNNVLMILGVPTAAKTEVAALDGLVEIPPEVHSRVDPVHPSSIDFSSTEWHEWLSGQRALLENHWSDSTAHPKYFEIPREEADPRGQCGVASVWLARKLRTDLRVEPTYCFGRLSFDAAGVGDVDHHCWVEIGDGADPRRTVIDLTGDQARGNDVRVITGPHEELRSRGIHYEPTSRLPLDALPTDRVWPRFLVLDDRLGPRR